MNIRNPIAITATVIAALAVTSLYPVRKVLADSASFYAFGVNNNSSLLNGDQGGSFELAGSAGYGTPSTNPVSGGTPYMDFHFGNGQSEDYNMRIINDGNHQLTVQSPGKTMMSITDHNALINGGIDPASSGIKHIKVGACNAPVNGYCYTQITWAGAPFTDSNYDVTCTNSTPANAGAQIYVPEDQKTTTTMRVYVANQTGQVVTGGSLNCIAIHV